MPLALTSYAEGRFHAPAAVYAGGLSPGSAVFGPHARQAHSAEVSSPLQKHTKTSEGAGALTQQLPGTTGTQRTNPAPVPMLPRT